LDVEAAGVARQFIEKKYVACGDSRLYYPCAGRFVSEVDASVEVEAKLILTAKRASRC
jgi:hypothetical protein